MIDPYASHIPILEFIFKEYSISNVFEFGPGKYSTKFFEENAKHTVSVELTSRDWFNKIKDEVDNDKVDALYITDLNETLKLFVNSQNLDLVFVDGSFESRIHCIEAAFEKSSIIVTHDTEMANFQNDPYKWNNIRMNKDYFWIDVMEFIPWTSIITNKIDLVNKTLLKYDKSRVK